MAHTALAHTAVALTVAVAVVVAVVVVVVLENETITGDALLFNLLSASYNVSSRLQKANRAKGGRLYCVPCIPDEEEEEDEEDEDRPRLA